MKKNTWKIRDGEGHIFGPSPIEELQNWARDMRLMPGFEASQDNGNWVPVESLPELEMDWIARLPTGQFFGPVHRDALKEAIWNRDVAENAPVFIRMASINETPESLRAANDALKAQIEELRTDFAERATKIEAECASAKAERELAVSELSMKDRDFEVERQSFAAEKSRLEAIIQTLQADASKLKSIVSKVEKREEAAAIQTEKAHADLAAAQAELKLVQADLAEKDEEFEAERQSFAAERSRMEAERQGLSAEKNKLLAEIAKAEKRAEVVASQAADAESRNRSREVDTARIAELEKQILEDQKDIKHLQDELESQAADARRERKTLEINHIKERESIQGQLRDTKALADQIKVLQTREEMIRQLLMQAASIIGKGSEEIAEAEAVIIDESKK